MLRKNVKHHVNRCFPVRAESWRPQLFLSYRRFTFFSHEYHKISCLNFSTKPHLFLCYCHMTQNFFGHVPERRIDGSRTTHAMLALFNGAACVEARPRQCYNRRALQAGTSHSLFSHGRVSCFFFFAWGCVKSSASMNRCLHSRRRTASSNTRTVHRASFSS